MIPQKQYDAMRANGSLEEISKRIACLAALGAVITSMQDEVADLLKEQRMYTQGLKYRGNLLTKAAEQFTNAFYECFDKDGRKFITDRFDHVRAEIERVFIIDEERQTDSVIFNGMEE